MDREWTLTVRKTAYTEWDYFCGFCRTRPVTQELLQLRCSEFAGTAQMKQRRLKGKHDCWVGVVKTHANIMSHFTGWTTDAINLSTTNEQFRRPGIDGYGSRASKGYKEQLESFFRVERILFGDTCEPSPSLELDHKSLNSAERRFQLRRVHRDWPLSALLV